VNKVMALLSFIGLVSASHCYAGCVYGAKNKSSFIVLDNHTFVLQGGSGSDILVKTYAYVRSSSEITVLKDSFCSYDTSAIYIDGELAQLKQVEKL
jgi:hypothetical protein